MKKNTVAATVALLVVIIVASVFATNLVEMRVRWMPSLHRQAPDHVNVPVYWSKVAT